TLPIIATDVFTGDAAVMGLLLSSMGAGAILGGLVSARTLRGTPRELFLTALCFGGVILVTSFAPTITLFTMGLFLVGLTSSPFKSSATALLQIGSAPDMRGRVMALWLVAFLGTRLVGAPFVGWVDES